MFVISYLINPIADNKQTTDEVQIPDNQIRYQPIANGKSMKDGISEAEAEKTIEPLSNVSEAEGQIKGSIYTYYNSPVPFAAVLVLYLSRQLLYSDDDATIIFHVFAVVNNFLCVLGAIISDGWLGRFKAISYFSLVYVAGAALIALGAVPPLNLPARTITLTGLALIGLGSGMMKPSITAFGGDQFKLPEQVKQLATFFSLYYFAVNAGALISITATPILREDVYCFGEQECPSLAFGAPAILMAVSLFIFILGRPFYKSKPPAGNVVMLVGKTVGNAIATKWKEKNTNPRKHWLDYADKKYDRQLIEDVKVLMRILVLYLPLPVFWALFDQQSSRWTIQATRMDGDMGSWDIKPDQMQMLNPLLILAFIPLYELAFYPLLGLVGIRRPLQKLTLGGIFAGIAFVVSGVVELQLEKTYPVLPSAGNAQLRVYNGELCDYSITTNLTNFNFDVASLNMYKNSTDIGSEGFLYVRFDVTSKSASCDSFASQTFIFNSSTSHYLFLNSKNTAQPLVWGVDTISKPSRGYPLGRTLANVEPSRQIDWKNKKGAIQHTEPANLRNITELKSGTYQILVDNVEIVSIYLKVGGIYTILINEDSSGQYRNNVIVVTEPNSMSIFWLIPQYVIMTLGEVMFSVTGLEFTYAQAPLTMKSVLQACWLLTMAFGNLLVIIIAKLKLFDSQAYEFFLFAGLMFVDMIVFMFVAYRYKPNSVASNSETETLTPPEKSEKDRIDMATLCD
ncbi:PREDICTED: peptide transporter family 1-like [Rhagoletis zephyria]|uniref:peptide transporter family 1-like n=1 Tax=Rhagoletis zephyria TaxID=28612 RepID=UPI0008113667|nr:PREDICTED: peptide transporter family 1-like [Rhagoletis zephyria]